MLKLSPSKIRLFTSCGLRYRYEQENPTPFQTTPAAAFGSFLHAALRRLYEHPPNASRLEPLLRSVWDENPFTTDEESDVFFAKGLTALKRYCDEFFVDGAPDSKTIACERFLSFIIERNDIAVEFTARADRLAVADDGALEIIDYKATLNGGIQTEESLATDLVAFLYFGLAKVNHPSYKQFRVRYLNLLSLKSATVEFSGEQVAANKEALWREIEKIARGVFEPRVDEGCSWCPHRSKCPAAGRRIRFEELV